MTRLSLPDIGVALSGSGFLFPAHIGALCGLHDCGYNIREIAGTSGGGLVSILYASGMPLPDMKNLIMTQDWSVFLEPAIWGWWKGLCDSQPMVNWLVTHTNNKTFGQTNIPLTIATSDITNAKGFYFSTFATPDVLLSLGGRATSGLPFIYPHTDYNGMVLMDGGMCNNIAVDQLTPNMPKVGIDLTSVKKPMTSINVIDITKQLVDIMMASNEDLRMAWAEQTGSTIISVDCGNSSFLNNKMAAPERQGLFDAGYNTVFNQLNS